MPKPEQLVAELEAAGKRMAAADAERAAALEQLRKAARAAHGEVPVTRMAELGHVSRVTMYRLLED